jgi:hypothetical protein
VRRHRRRQPDRTSQQQPQRRPDRSELRRNQDGRAARLAAAGSQRQSARIEDKAPIIEIVKLTVELYGTLYAEVSAMLQGTDAPPACGGVRWLPTPLEQQGDTCEGIE